MPIVSKRKLYETQDQLREKQRQNEDQLRQLQQLSQDYAELRSRLNQLTAENKAQAEQIDGLIADKQQQAEQIDGLIADKQQQAEQIDGLLADKRQQAEQISELSEKNQQQSDALYVVREDNKNKADYIGQLQDQIFLELRPQIDQLEEHSRQMANAREQEKAQEGRSFSLLAALIRTLDSGEWLCGNEYSYADLLQFEEKCGTAQFAFFRRLLFDALARELAKKEKIKVALVYTLSTTWGLDSLYKTLEKSERFQPVVIVLPPYGTEKVREGFQQNWRLAQEKGYACIAGYDLEIGQFYNEIAQIGADIVFWQVPYALYQPPWQPEQMPLSVLQCYVPYGFNLSHLEQDHFNLPAHLCMWRYYADHVGTVARAGQLGRLKGDGVYFSGLPKLDNIVLEKAGEESPKTIIWAPHHSLPGEASGLCMATFDQNKEFFYEYAKGHPQIRWILRPHPLLGERCVQCGVYADEKEYEAYLDQWRALPNAVVSTQGDMQQEFGASSAMILDSVGFLAEYLYYQKPMLHLVRKDVPNHMNAFGTAIVNALPAAYGTAFDEIGRFISAVADGSAESQTEQQKHLFQEELDYRSINGESAGEYILHNMHSALDTGRQAE